MRTPGLLGAAVWPLDSWRSFHGTSRAQSWAGRAGHWSWGDLAWVRWEAAAWAWLVWSWGQRGTRPLSSWPAALQSMAWTCPRMAVTGLVSLGSYWAPGAAGGPASSLWPLCPPWWGSLGAHVVTVSALLGWREETELWAPLTWATRHRHWRHSLPAPGSSRTGEKLTSVRPVSAPATTTTSAGFNVLTHINMSRAVTSQWRVWCLML